MEWKPFELRPKPQETLRPEGDYLQQAWRDSVLPLAEKMGVEMSLPTVSPQPHTHLAHEGFQFARENGRGGEYTHAVFRAFFQRDRDIGQLDVLADVAGELGLNRDRFRTALETRKYREKHQGELEYARQHDVRAIPTFLIDGIRMRGLIDESRLHRAIDRALSDE